MIEPDFDPDQIVELVQVADTLSLIALRQIGVLADNNEIFDEINQKLTGVT